MKIAQKLGKKVFFSIFCIVAVICFFLLIIYLGNHYIYPDSYLYLITAKTNSFFQNNIINLGFNYQADYFTLLKPLSPIFLNLFHISQINITFINILCLVAAFFVIYKAAGKKHSLVFLSLVFSAFVFNGNSIYWISRYGSEFISIFILSLILYFGKMKKFTFYTLLFTILCLVRFEFIFIFPVLNLLFKIPKKLIYLFYSSTVIYAFFIAVLSSNVLYFLTHILIPLAAILLITYLVNLKNIKLFIDNNFKYFKIIAGLFYLGFFIVLALTLLSITSDSGIDGRLGGFSRIGILMMGIILIYLFNLNLNWNKTQAISLLSMFVLGTIYLWTAQDSFRYWLYITPLMLFSIMLNEYKYPKVLINLSVIVLLIQIVILIYVVPWQILQENYWLNRLDILANYKQDYLIYNSTPLATSFAGFKSEDICNYQNKSLQEKAIFIIDDLSIFRCKEKMMEIRILSGNMQYLGNYPTQKIVEINRYVSYGQNSQNYKLN